MFCWTAAAYQRSHIGLRETKARGLQIELGPVLNNSAEASKRPKIFGRWLMNLLLSKKTRGFGSENTKGNPEYSYQGH
jgi:hypothetical protein